MEYLIDTDTSFFLWLNSLHADWLDPIMALWSSTWPWIPMYVLIAAALVWRYGWRQGLLLILVLMAVVGLADFITASVIRPLAHRLRPANPENPISSMVHIVDGYRGGRYGFPSCHAANTFALALASSILLRWRPYIVFIYCWALLQCYSRIYLGVHYPGDLLVGAIVGTCCAWLALPAYRWITRSIKSRGCP